MKFITFERGGAQCVGLWLEGDRVLDLQAAAEAGGETLDASSMLAFIAGGDAALKAAASLQAKAGSLGAAVLDGKSVKLLAPIPRPTKNVFCVGLNYVDHFKESVIFKNGGPMPTVPTFFTKLPTTVVGPEVDVRWDPKITQKPDYEIELGVIIGKAGRDIAAEAAFDHVFGYTIINDVSARDLQFANDGKQWFKSKSLDTTCPMGPCIVDKAAIGDPKNMELTLTLNGERRQNSTVDNLIFDIPTIIADLSRGITLEPGDIISTGTPAGVGNGMDPPSFLKGGDVMVLEISGIGRLTNRVVQV